MDPLGDRTGCGIRPGGRCRHPRDHIRLLQNTGPGGLCLNLNSRRKTTQHLAPAEPFESEEGSYNIYPAYPCETGSIFDDLDRLADEIACRKQVVIDGYAGVLWQDLREKLETRLYRKSVQPVWIDAASCLLPEEEINGKIAPFLGGDDPVFGRRYPGRLQDFFDPEKIGILRTDESRATIIYGVGAALLRPEWQCIYVDLPKNELQFRMRAGAIRNIGAAAPRDAKLMYKRFYFIDWIVLNRHKKTLLPRIALLVDGQRPDRLLWMYGDQFRMVLDEMSMTMVRPRPWFEPGPWGGQWIKTRIPGLAKEVPNYAWSFELITPENGIMLSSGEKLLEFSFDFLMFARAERILGRAYERFGCDFPIRFDFLDTFDGGNLSIQCHPRPEYMKKHFGEPFTQDEAYYILDAGDDARVFLGFQEDIDPREFREQLEKSVTENREVDIPRFVQMHDSHRHDLFLIPGGTVHGSGKNNLVLEISSTPYIFTFKMYDWLRLDLDGNPRPINIEHAFSNLVFERKGRRVREELISRPRIIDSGDGWNIVHLPTHRDHFYDVHRIEFDDAVTVDTGDRCHVLMLVEGTSMEIVSGNGMRSTFNYAETVVIPAAAESYTLINRGRQRAKVVKAFVK